VSESAVRECLEEAGAKVRPKRIVAIHVANRHCEFLYPCTIYKVIVECELIESNFVSNTETLEADFFPIDSLPRLSTERNTRSQIELCYEARKHPVFEANFD
jgi:ADP-ribose pyrophosphatase YjhB (NUDIX family)